jgi:cobalt-zinc-cadmium efflux system outer membrane protein
MPRKIQASALWNLFGAGGGIGSGGLSALVAPFRPGERGARIARAQARVEETKSQVTAQEWKLAADIRKAYLSVWALEEQLKIDDTAVRLQERVLKFFREKRQLGDASRLDLNLVNIEYAQALRQREVTASERDRARQSLSELLGLPPLYELSLKQPSDPIAYQAFHLDPAALESLMIERRPQLAAAKQEYEQAEQDLRLAYIQRIPWFRLGPSYERESGGGEGTVDRLGAGLGLDLPLFNRNQGAIASLEANRDKLREGFTAKVHTARLVQKGSRHLRTACTEK